MSPFFQIRGPTYIIHTHKLPPEIRKRGTSEVNKMKKGKKRKLSMTKRAKQLRKENKFYLAMFVDAVVSGW